MRTAIKRLVQFTLMTSLLMVIGHFILNNPYSHNLFKAAIYEKFEEYSELELDFETLSLSLVPLEITIYGIRLDAPSKYPKSSLLHISHLQISLSYWDLFIGYKRLNKIIAHDMELNWPPPWDFKNLLKDKKPIKNQKKQTEKGFEWNPNNIPLNELILINARVIGSFPLNEEIPLVSSYLSLAFSGLDLKIKFSRSKRIDIGFISNNSSLYIDRNELLQEARLSAELEVNDTKITGNFLSVKSNLVDMRGKLNSLIEKNPQNNVIEGIKINSSWDVQANFQLLGNYLAIKDTKGLAKGDLNINSYISLNGEKPKQLTFDGKVETEDSYIGGIRLYDSSSNYFIDHKGIEFEDLKIKRKGKYFGNAKGYLGFNSSVPFDFYLDAESLPLDDLLAAFSVSTEALDANVKGHSIHIAGVGNPLDLNVSGNAKLDNIYVPLFNLNRSSFPQDANCDLELDLNINSKRLKFDKASGSCYENSNKEKTLSPIDVNGNIYFNNQSGIDLNIFSPKLNLKIAQNLAQVSLAGASKVSTSIKGPYDNIITSINLDAEKVKVNGVKYDKINGSSQIKNATLSWKNLSIKPSASESLFSKFGSMNLQNLYFYDTALIVNNLSSNFINHFITSFSEKNKVSFGIKSADLRWKGPLLEPAKNIGSYDASLNNLIYEDELLANSIRLKAQSDKEHWQIKESIINLKGLEFATDIKINKRRNLINTTDYKKNKTHDSLWKNLGFNLKDNISISIRTLENQTETSSLQFIPFISEKLKVINLEGQLKLRAAFNGTLDYIQGGYEASIYKMSILKSSIAPLHLKGFLDGSEFKTNFTHSGDTLEGRLALDVSKKGWPFKWYFQFRDFDARALFSQYFYKDPRNFAYLTGHWDFKGTFANWWESIGEFYIKNINLQYTLDSSRKSKLIRLASAESSTILFRKNIWSFKDRTLLRLIGDHTSAQIKLNESNPPNNLSIAISGKLDSSILPYFSDYIESASGDIGFNGSLTGPIDNLQSSAKIFSLPRKDLENDQGFSLGIQNIRPEFKNIDFKLSLQNDSIQLQKLEAKKGSGTIKASGEMFTSAKQNATQNSRLNINLDQIKVIYPIPYLKNFETILSGDLQFTGQKPPFLLAGDIQVDKARSTNKVDLREEVVNALRRNSLINSSNLSNDPLLNLNINLIADKSIFIQNKNIKVLMSSDLQISGNEKKQIVLGHLNVEKGKIIYKRDFDLKRGEIIFDNPSHINPTIDIIGTTEVNPYTVTVTVGGKASNPVLELLVDPPTHDNGQIITSIDAFVLLARGSLPKVEQNSAEAQGAGLSEIINSIVWTQGQVPFEKFSEKFGQDLIQIYPDMTTDDKGSPVVQLNGTVKVTDNIDAVYKKTSSKQEFSVDVPIHQNITLSGSMVQNQNDELDDNKGKENTSVDIKFRFPIK